MVESEARLVLLADINYSFISSQNTTFIQNLAPFGYLDPIAHCLFLLQKKWEENQLLSASRKWFYTDWFLSSSTELFEMSKHKALIYTTAAANGGSVFSNLNYFINRSTNASPESFNAKIKVFRAQFRGVKYIGFFMYRLTNIFA